MAHRSNDVRIVLVRPRNPLNIGAAARAMGNFGFDDLVVVAPHGPNWEEARSAAGAAPTAKDLLRSARVTSDLAAAIEDRSTILGASSLSRRKPSQAVVSLDRLSENYGARLGDKLALVFGSEKTGLSNHDLALCHAILRIPTLPGCPSMNLGQAVAVCCYELHRLLEPSRPESAVFAPTASSGEIGLLIEQIESLLGSIRPAAERREGRQFDTREAQMRQALQRWAVTGADVSFLLGILRDLKWRTEHPALSQAAVPRAGEPDH